MNYTEVAEARKTSLTKKVDRFATFAEHAQERSDEHWKKSDLSFIPMGQPILMGHHSQRAHENAIERSNAHSYKSIEEEETKRWQRRSEHAADLLVKMEESKPYMANKIDESEKDIRMWERRIEEGQHALLLFKLYERKGESYASVHGYKLPFGRHQEICRATREKAQAIEKREFWVKKLESIGGVFDITTLKKGDLIKTTCGTFPVKSVNAKTVTVLNWLPGGTHKPEEYHTGNDRREGNAMTPLDLQEYAIDGDLTAYTVDELAVMLGACRMLSDRIKDEVVRRV